MRHPVQLVNGGLYVRGLLEEGPRKSLEPLVERLGGDADYQSMQQFLADSPWDPTVVVKATAERVAPAIDVEAWVLDDTGFPKDGKHSPGVKRQYSGTLGKVGNCQIGVSLHAVGSKGTVPLGWALYLPEEWCKDPARRKKAKIPAEVEFATKPQLGVDLAVRAAGWEIRKAPVLGDAAYGDNTELRDRLDSEGLRYVLSVSPETTVFTSETKFTAPAPRSGPGRRSPHPRPDRDPESIGQLISRLGEAPQDDHVSRRPTAPPNPGLCSCAPCRAPLARTDGKVAGARPEIPPREEWPIANGPKANRNRPTTGSRTCPPRPRAGGSPGSRGCAGRSSSTTASSKASSASTTTKDARGWGGITTPRWSPPPMGSSPSSDYTL